MARQYFVIKAPKGIVAGVSKVRKSVKLTTRTKYVKAFASFGSAQSFVDSYVHSGYGMSASKVVILPYTK
jgi:hypothetical protein